MKMMEHTINGMKQKVDAMNPIMFITFETRLEEFQKDLHELRNLYSSPQSSLNRVLDGLLSKVKDLEKHMYAKPSMYGEGGQSQEQNAMSEIPAVKVDEKDGNYY